MDAFIQLAEASTTITVIDSTAPTIGTVSVSPSCLWPANHKYVRFVLGTNVLATATDACDASPTVTIQQVTSNQPVGGSTGSILPIGIALDPSGGLYVSEQGHNAIRRIAPDRSVSTLAGPIGAPSRGYAEGCDGDARFSGAGKIAVASGRILISDAGYNNVIRSVSGAGCTKLIAGSPGSTVPPGRDGPASSAELVAPLAVYPGPDGIIYFVDEHRVRLYTP